MPFDPFNTLAQLPADAVGPIMAPQMPNLEPSNAYPPPPPIQRPTRVMLREILGGALYALGEGMKAAGQAPVGQGPTAGFGAALAAPEELAFRRQQMAREQAQQQLYEQQAAQAAANAVTIPSRAATYAAGVTGNLEARQAGLEQRAPLVEAQAKRLKYMYTPAGLIDLSGQQPQLIAGTGMRTQVEVTENMAKMLGLPLNMVGLRMNAQEINQLATVAQRPVRVIPTEEGVFAYNLETGEKSKIGDNPPPRQVGQFFPQLTEQGEIIGYVNPSTGRVVGQPEEFAGARRGPLAVGEIEKRVTLENLLEDADFIEGVAKKNPQVLGPVGGRFTSMLHQYGPTELQMMFPEHSKPEVMEMFRVALNIRNQLLYALSGKQINEREYARLAQLVPEVKVSPEVFQARLNEYRYELQRALARRKGKEPTATPPAARTGTTKRTPKELADIILGKP